MGKGARKAALPDFGSAAAFLFDCDGTLLDSLGAWGAAERDLIAEAGSLTDAQLDEIHSVPFEDCARIFHERYGVGASTRAVRDHLERELLGFYREEAKPLPGAVEFVGRLRSRGVPCAIVSSSPRRYIEAGLERAGLLDSFECIVCTDEAGISKSDPRIYLEALEKLGVREPERAWDVDDAAYAVEAIRKAGLHAIAPLDNGTKGEEGRRARLERSADIVVGTLEELL